jgi:hypothetical protein
MERKDAIGVHVRTRCEFSGFMCKSERVNAIAVSLSTVRYRDRMDTWVGRRYGNVAFTGSQAVPQSRFWQDFFRARPSRSKVTMQIVGGSRQPQNKFTTWHARRIPGCLNWSLRAGKNSCGKFCYDTSAAVELDMCAAPYDDEKIVQLRNAVQDLIGNDEVLAHWCNETTLRRFLASRGGVLHKAAKALRYGLTE